MQQEPNLFFQILLLLYWLVPRSYINVNIIEDTPSKMCGLFCLSFLHSFVPLHLLKKCMSRNRCSLNTRKMPKLRTETKQLSCLVIKKLQGKPAKLLFHIDETIQDWQAKEGQWEINCWNYHCIYYKRTIEKPSQRKMQECSWLLKVPDLRDSPSNVIYWNCSSFLVFQDLSNSYKEHFRKPLSYYCLGGGGGGRKRKVCFYRTDEAKPEAKVCLISWNMRELKAFLSKLYWTPVKGKWLFYLFKR